MVVNHPADSTGPPIPGFMFTLRNVSAAPEVSSSLGSRLPLVRRWGSLGEMRAGSGDLGEMHGRLEPIGGSHFSHHESFPIVPNYL